MRRESDAVDLCGGERRNKVLTTHCHNALLSTFEYFCYAGRVNLDGHGVSTSVQNEIPRAEEGVQFNVAETDFPSANFLHLAKREGSGPRDLRNSVFYGRRRNIQKCIRKTHVALSADALNDSFGLLRAGEESVPEMRHAVMWRPKLRRRICSVPF